MKRRGVYALLTLFLFIAPYQGHSEKGRLSPKSSSSPKTLTPKHTPQTAPAAVEEQNNQPQSFKKPDLVLKNISLQADKLILHIQNKGLEKAGPSTARVKLYFKHTAKVLHVTTPALNPGQTVNIGYIQIPGECYHPDCPVEIIVDVYDNVKESNESNNRKEEIIVG